jgi:hypothetical protein
MFSSPTAAALGAAIMTERARAAEKIEARGFTLARSLVLRCNMNLQAI